MSTNDVLGLLRSSPVFLGGIREEERDGLAGVGMDRIAAVNRDGTAGVGMLRRKISDGWLEEGEAIKVFRRNSNKNNREKERGERRFRSIQVRNVQGSSPSLKANRHYPLFNLYFKIFLHCYSHPKLENMCSRTAARTTAEKK